MARASRNLSTLFATTIAILSLSTPALAGKDDQMRRYLTAAERLFHNLDNERALEQVQRAKIYANGVDDDTTIALYEGTILLDLGRKEDGMAAYRTALLLKPTAKLPLKVSPKIQREFEALRTSVQSELAALQAQRDAEARRVADAKRAEEEQQKAAEAQRAAQKRSLEMPPAPKVAERPAVPAAATPSAEVVSKPSGPKMVPMVLSGAAVAVAGAGAFFGMMANSQYQEAKDATFQDDRMKAADKSNQSATLANVLFGVAGATAVGAVVTFAL